jgi:cytochrome oxidase assembly protein ShyY1
VSNIFVFWLLYPLASLVIFAQVPITDGLHQALFGHTPGEASILRYGVSWLCFTIAVMVAYLVWLRRHRRSWLLAPALGALAFLPGIIACAVSRH